MSKAIAVFGQVNIIAADFRASADFYRRLGLDVPEPDSDAPYHVGCSTANDVGLDLDSASFAQAWNKGWVGRGDLEGRVVIGFDVPTREKVDETYADLTGAGYRGLQDPWDAFWGARYAIVEDPNGVAVGLMSPVDRTRGYWPPQGWKE